MLEKKYKKILHPLKTMGLQINPIKDIKIVMKHPFFEPSNAPDRSTGIVCIVIGTRPISILNLAPIPVKKAKIKIILTSFIKIITLFIFKIISLEETIFNLFKFLKLYTFFLYRFNLFLKINILFFEIFFL